MKIYKNKYILLIAIVLLCIATNQTRAGMYDLTGVSAGGYDEVTINDAWFYNVNAASTGSGVINSFVRIGSNDDIEQGYNSDYRSNQAPKYPEFDEDKSSIYNHSLLLTSVPVVNLDGILYREFLLDINQNKTGDGRYLSLDSLEIYVANTGDMHGYPNLGTQIYDLDETEDNWIVMDYSLNNGSGSGDLFAYIPNNLFVGGSYVYLYSMFGVHYANTARFEEWAVRLGGDVPPPPPVPVPGAFILGMLGLCIAGKKLRKYA